MRDVIRFGLVSTVGAAIDFVVVTALVSAGVSAAVSLAVSMAISGSVVYALHQRYTFQERSGRQLRVGRFASFLVNTLLVYGFRFVILKAALSFGLAVPVAVGGSLVASFAVNFLISKYLIFSASDERSER